MGADPKVRENLRSGERSAIGALDRAVSEFLLAEFREGTVERRASLEKDIRDLRELMREHVALLSEALNGVDQRLLVLRRLAANGEAVSDGR